MGIFTDISRFLFGGDSKSSSVSDVAQTQSQTQTSDQNTHSLSDVVQGSTQTGSQTQTSSETGASAQTGGTKSTSGTTGTSVTSQLDPQTLQVLQGIIPGLAGKLGGSAGAAGDVAGARNAAGQLVANSNTDVSALIKAAQDTAKLNFAQNEAPAISQAQQAIGSRGNTFSQQLEQQGNVQLSTRLAQIAADITTNARGQSDQELMSAIDAFTKTSAMDNANTAAPLQNLLAAIQAASGAVTSTTQGQTGTQDIISQVNASNTQSGTQTGTSTATGTQNTRSISDVQQLLTQLAEAESLGHSVTSGEAAQNNGWLNNIVGLFK